MHGVATVNRTEPQPPTPPDTTLVATCEFGSNTTPTMERFQPRNCRQAPFPKKLPTRTGYEPKTLSRTLQGSLHSLVSAACASWLPNLHTKKKSDVSAHSKRHGTSFAFGCRWPTSTKYCLRTHEPTGATRSKGTPVDETIRKLEQDIA